QPNRIRLAQHPHRSFIVSSIRIHRPENHVVLENKFTIQQTRIDTNRLSTMRYSSQADNTVWICDLDYVKKERRCTGAFQDHIDTINGIADTPGVIFSAQCTDDLRLQTFCCAIQHVDIEAT